MDVMLYYRKSEKEVEGEIECRVVSVPDGDGLNVECDGALVMIRLWGIDAPEWDQPYGRKAQRVLQDLCLEKDLRILIRGGDRYGRKIGDVVLDDGLRVSEEMVRLGMAWWYKEYAPEDYAIRDLELRAREDRVGLWADVDPVAPWTHRHTWIPTPLSGGAVVYRTRSGGGYHRAACRWLSGSRIQIVKRRAICRGYRACGQCCP